MDTSSEDIGAEEEPVTDDKERLEKELALQAALNAEAEKKLSEAGGLNEKKVIPPIEQRDMDVERKLAAMVAERMAQEEAPAPSRRSKKAILVLVIVVLLIAAVTVFEVHQRFPGQEPPSSAMVDKPTQPPPLERTRVSFKLGQNTLMVNDMIIDMDVAPQNINDRVMLPVSYVASALNCQVEWDAAEQKVSLKSDNRLIEVWIGKSTALVNGKETIIDPNNDKVTPTIVPPGRTMVPLRFLAESLGSQVDWNQGEQAVTITN